MSKTIPDAFVDSDETPGEGDPQGTADSPVTEQPASSLMEQFVRHSPGSQTDSPLERFLGTDSLEESLRVWLHDRQHQLRYALSKDVIVRMIDCDIARLDALLNDQVNAILHHPRFQRLEASWRGVQFLVNKAEQDDIKIRILAVTWKELTNDMTRAMEFDQSHLFGKVYSEEFGTPGGVPYGVLIGDYEIRHRPGPGHRIDDLETLRGIMQVAAAAFAPFIAGAHPSIFGLDDFADLQRPLNLSRSFEQTEYIKWKALRDADDARFVGLTLPRVLMRIPYEDDGSREDNFRFRENVAGPDRSKLLWGTAAFAFASVLIRAYTDCGWLADIRGVRRDLDEGGLVTGLPVHDFETDAPGIALKFSTDVVVSDDREKELGDLGFIPLCTCKDTVYSAFYGNQSIQKPKRYDDMTATINARISTMLQYMLCISRFAHYVKVLGREKVGSFAEPTEFESFVHKWLQKYVTSDDEASPEVKAKYPLREGKVQIREHPGKPGHFMCTVHLRPHFQLDELVASVKLVTEAGPATA